MSEATAWQTKKYERCYVDWCVLYGHMTILIHYSNPRGNGLRLLIMLVILQCTWKKRSMPTKCLEKKWVLWFSTSWIL